MKRLRRQSLKESAARAGFAAMKRQRQQTRKPETRAATSSAGMGAWDNWSWMVDGSRISENRALSFSAIYRCCELIASTVGKLPCVVYRRTDEGKEPDRTHPAYRLLKYEWNSEHTAVIALGLTMFRRLFYGNGYAYIKRNPMGRVEELIPLATDTHPVRVNGQLRYVVYVDSSSGQGSRQIHLRPDEVLHLRSPIGDSLAGYSLVSLASSSWNAAVSSQEFSENFFINDASPGIVIQYPGPLKQEAIMKLRKGWSNAHQGVSKSHMPAVLENGATIDHMQVSAKDMQLIEHILRRASAQGGRRDPHRIQ